MMSTHKEHGIEGVQKLMMVRFLEKLSNEDLKTFVAPFMTIDEEEQIKKMKE